MFLKALFKSFGQAAVPLPWLKKEAALLKKEPWVSLQT